MSFPPSSLGHASRLPSCPVPVARRMWVKVRRSPDDSANASPSRADPFGRPGRAAPGHVVDVQHAVGAAPGASGRIPAPRRRPGTARSSRVVLDPCATAARVRNAKNKAAGVDSMRNPAVEAWDVRLDPAKIAKGTCNHARSPRTAAAISATMGCAPLVIFRGNAAFSPAIVAGPANAPRTHAASRTEPLVSGMARVHPIIASAVTGVVTKVAVRTVRWGAEVSAPWIATAAGQFSAPAGPAVVNPPLGAITTVIVVARASASASSAV